MALSEGLDAIVGQYDKGAISTDPSLIGDLIAANVAWLQNETGWWLGATEVKTLYFSGGSPTIYLPQPGAIQEVAIRYGASWIVEDDTLYELIGDENGILRELIRADGGLWPGMQISFARTPRAYSSSSFSSSHHRRRIRVKLSTGFDEASEWPQDLIGVLRRAVASEFRTRSLVRPKTGIDGVAQEERFPSAQDWRTIKYYRRMGKDVAA